jgi:glutaminase
MKPTAVLVNVVRGEMVDEEMLYRAVAERTIAGAALDVWYRYSTGPGHTPPAQQPFHELPNVLITPHASGWGCSSGSRSRRSAAEPGVRKRTRRPSISPAPSMSKACARRSGTRGRRCRSPPGRRYRHHADFGCCASLACPLLRRPGAFTHMLARTRVDVPRNCAPPPASPILALLHQIHDAIGTDDQGRLATYIPELATADRDRFGIALATADGHLYEVGDADQPFTIQSVAKPFVYGLALEDHGPEHVLSKVGVEPSGDPFNSIVFDERSNRPFNPMVNAGAIATTALIKGDGHAARLDRILAMLGRFAGRRLEVDEAVHRSEQATGHRNRAIAYLALNAGMIDGRVDEHLDLYFGQCSVLVTARDLAVMAATLAGGGVNHADRRARARAASHRERPRRDAELWHVRLRRGMGLPGRHPGQERRRRGASSPSSPGCSASGPTPRSSTSMATAAAASGPATRSPRASTCIRCGPIR